MQGAFGFVEKLVGGTTHDNGASFTGSDTGKLDESVFTDNDFFNEVALAQLDEFGVVKGGSNFTTQDKGETLDTGEIGVLNSSDTRVGKELFGPVVDELTVDEAYDKTVIRNYITSKSEE